MAKVTYDEVNDYVADPLLSDNFEIVFPNLPAGVGDGKRLRVQCKTASKPGTEIEAQLVELFGHGVNHAGRKTFTKQFALSFQEDSKMSIHDIFEKWHEFIRGTQTQLGTFKKDYAVSCDFIVYQQDGSVAKTYKLQGVWPTQNPETSFDQGGQALEVQGQFSFDIYTVE